MTKLFFLFVSIFLIGEAVVFGQGSASDAGDLVDLVAGSSTPQPAEVDTQTEGGGGGGEVLADPVAPVSQSADVAAISKTKEGGKDVENFIAFVYSPGPRDPFISPNSPSTIVQEVPGGEDITLESLMAFAEKLKLDLGQRIRVVGVSIPPTGGEPFALVIYATGKATKGGADIVPALPPRTVNVQTGLPVRYPEEETLFISKLAQLVAQSSPVRLKRDTRAGAVIFPIQEIDDRGVLVSLPGYDEPILLPVYREVDPRTESDN